METLLRKDSLRNWLIRYSFYFSGLVCFSLGVAISVKMQHLGLHPWDVLNIAFFDRFGFSIGTWSVIIGLLLIAISLVISREYVSLGTFLNALLIGPIMDFFLWLNILPAPSYTWTDYLWLLVGIVVVGTGGGLYVSGGIGAGPRDGFMLAMSERTGFSISKARIMVESVVLLVGYLLGGPVFFVSFLYTFIMSPVFQLSLKFFTRLKNELCE